MHVPPSSASTRRCSASDPEVQELEREIRSLYFRSAWFYIPVAFLVAAIAFATLGLIKMNDATIDVQKAVKDARDAADRASTEVQKTARDTIRDARDAADKAEEKITKRAGVVDTAVKEAKEQVDKSTKEFNSFIAALKTNTDEQTKNNINLYVEGAKRQASKDLVAHIETVKREQAPNLNTAIGASMKTVSDLEVRQRSLEDSVTTLEKRSALLHTLLQQTGLELDRLGVKVLSAVLDRPATVVVGVILASATAFLMSMVALSIAWRRRQRA